MALLRSAARSARLRQLLDQQGRLLARSPVESPHPRLLSSSVPTKRHGSFPSSDPRSRATTQVKWHNNEKKEDALKRLSTKIDLISDGLDRQIVLLEELELQMKKSREIDLTPAVVLISASFLSFVLYKFVQG